MYYRTFRGSFYVLYGALTIGLILTSILSPLEYREVDGYELYVYGVRVIYDVPVVTDPSTSTSSASASDSSSSTDATTPTTTNAKVNKAMNTMSLIDQERISQNWLYQMAERHSDVKNRAAASDSEIIITMPSSASSESAAPQKVRHVVYLHRLPKGKLRSVMIAYLLFAAASLAASLVVITVGFLNVMPPTRYVFFSRHSYIVFIVCILLVTLTFAMAAVCVSQNAMYRVIADDLYSQTEVVAKTYYRKARSGFSCTVAAVGVGIMMIISIGVSLTRAI